MHQIASDLEQFSKTIHASSVRLRGVTEPRPFFGFDLYRYFTPQKYFQIFFLVFIRGIVRSNYNLALNELQTVMFIAKIDGYKRMFIAMISLILITTEHLKEKFIEYEEETAAHILCNCIAFSNIRQEQFQKTGINLENIKNKNIILTIKNIIKFMRKTKVLTRPNKLEKWQLSPNKNRKRKRS